MLWLWRHLGSCQAVGHFHRRYCSPVLSAAPVFPTGSPQRLDLHTDFSMKCGQNTIRPLHRRNSLWPAHFHHLQLWQTGVHQRGRHSNRTPERPTDSVWLQLFYCPQSHKHTAFPPINHDFHVCDVTCNNSLRLNLDLGVSNLCELGMHRSHIQHQPDPDLNYLIRYQEK